MGADQYSLVADIGGTNARFAMVDRAAANVAERRPVEARNLSVDDYPTLVDATRAYLDQVGLGEPFEAAMSIALPVTGDELKMTNHHWRFSVKATRAALGLRHLKVLNDYTALALALPVFTPEQCLAVGPGQSLDGYPRAVLGPGTGLGVSGVVPAGDHWVPLESEGGHVSYGPKNLREQAVIEVMREKKSHISAETLVSGGGLELIYESLMRLETGFAEKLSPGEVSRLALAGENPIAEEALSMFFAVLGTVAGNLALTLGARGGVYIGGGIVLKNLEFFKSSGFRERFEQHGRLTDYLRGIPTYVINTDYPALIGATVALGKNYESVGVSSHDPC